MSDRNAPKIKTLQSWKSEFNWLTFGINIGLQCNVCKKWKEKIISVKNFSDIFTKGSTNYRKSTIADHAKTAQHSKSLKLEENKTCMSESRKYQMHIIHTAPTDSPICCGINEMSKWAKLQGIKFTVPYQNCKQCTKFIKYISQALFDENIRKKLERANFIAIFCDRSSGIAVVEKECIYILFADPDNFQPKLTFRKIKLSFF